jgi:hypothetical protein
LGFLAALGGVGGGGANFQIPSGGDFGIPSGGTSGTPELPNGNPFDQLSRISPENWQMAAALGLGLCCVLLVIGIALWLIGLSANGGLIVGASRAEAGDSVAFGEVWRAGTARLGSFIGMRILLAIPSLLILVIIGVTVAIAIAGVGGLAALSDRAQSEDAAGLIGILFSGIACVAIPLFCVAWIYGIIANAIQMLGDRAISIDQVGAMDAIRQGWALFRSNLGNVLVMGIILALIGIGVGIVTAIVAGIVLVPSIVLMVSQASRETGPQPVSFVVFGLSLLLFFVIAAVISALVVAFRATVWTLIYRQITGKGAVLPPASSAPPAPLPLQ